MIITPGKYYLDNDDNVYKCLVVKSLGDYTEAVMEIMGEDLALIYAVFYRTNWAWLDRECPDFKLIEEVEYFPSVVV